MLQSMWESPEEPNAINVEECHSDAFTANVYRAHWHIRPQRHPAQCERTKQSMLCWEKSFISFMWDQIHGVNRKMHYTLLDISYSRCVKFRGQLNIFNFVEMCKHSMIHSQIVSLFVWRTEWCECAVNLGKAGMWSRWQPRRVRALARLC